MESKKFSWLRYLVIATLIFVLEYIYINITIYIRNIRNIRWNEN